MSRAKRRSTPAASRVDALAFAALASTGLVLSLVLARIHAHAAAGGTPSFCSLGELVNCDRVALSRYSQLLGFPVALWGAFGYAIMLLAALARLPRPAPSSWPLGIMLLLSGAAAAASVPLALASAFVLRALCLLCAATWLADWALLGVALRMARHAGGPAHTVREDARLVAAHPWRALATGSVVTVLVVGGLAGFSVAFATAPPPANAAAISPQPPLAQPTTRSMSQPVTIFEFSDYECPHCARAHGDLRAALAGREDVRLEHRNFPLDQACNPLVPRPFHRSACALARAAICAGDQGRFWEMNDALFANQSVGRSVEEVAATVGLDIDALRRCQDAPETARRLDQEIAAGLRAGVTAAPTYVVGGAIYQGSLPARILGPSN